MFSHSTRVQGSCNNAVRYPLPKPALQTLASFPGNFTTILGRSLDTSHPSRIVLSWREAYQSLCMDSAWVLATCTFHRGCREGGIQSGWEA